LGLPGLTGYGAAATGAAACASCREKVGLEAPIKSGGPTGGCVDGPGPLQVGQPSHAGPGPYPGPGNPRSYQPPPTTAPNAPPTGPANPGTPVYSAPPGSYQPSQPSPPVYKSSVPVTGTPLTVISGGLPVRTAQVGSGRFAKRF
jgi:hypothetical protein